jgi:hypothetical protein
MMNQSALLRPDWTPATVALMVLGFMVFWPLGLAMLAYILFGEKFQNFKRDANQKVDGAFAWCRTNGYSATATTGNVAFDDWRKAELERLDEERRRLDEMRADFDAYARELRRAKDQEEFDRFMRDRQQVKPAGDGGPVQGFTGN